MSNTIRTLFPNLISAVSHDKLQHSENGDGWRCGGAGEGSEAEER